ncbi:MAG: DUF484 family protein [Mariprofundaceae bacterium]|nr:DUF484 family protein [Mariprofundaceae bacterium]
MTEPFESANDTSDITAPADLGERRMQHMAAENKQLRQYVASMMHRLRENDQLFTRLFDLEASVLSAGDPEDVCFTLLRELRSQFNLDMVRFWFDRDSLVGSCRMSSLSEHDLVWLEAGEIEAMGLAQRNVWLLQMDQGGFSWLQQRDEDLGSLALLRLGRSNRPFGILGLGSLDDERFSPEQSSDFLQHLAQVVGLSLEHAISRERLARLAITDALTGSHNRRFLQPYSHQPISSWFGKETAVACIYFDMDDFKGLNDRMGHAAGDDVLNHFCLTVRQYVRTQDPLIRMGGDEFTLLLPGCDLEKANKIARSIGNDMDKAGFNGESIGVSMGLSWSAPDDDMKLHNLIQHADKAMYVAKALGGNRLELAANLIVVD